LNILGFKLLFADFLVLFSLFFLLFLYYFQPGYGRHSTAPSHPVALVQRKVLGKWLMATQTTPIARGRNVGYFYVFFLYFFKTVFYFFY